MLSESTFVALRTLSSHKDNCELSQTLSFHEDDCECSAHDIEPRELEGIR